MLRAFVQLYDYLAQSLESDSRGHGLGVFLVGTRSLRLVVDAVDCDLRGKNKTRLLVVWSFETREHI